MTHCRPLAMFAVLIVVFLPLLWGPRSAARRADEQNAVFLTSLQALEGEWQVEPEVTIRGKLYGVSGVMALSNNVPVRMIFPTRGNYDVFDAWIGYHDGRSNGHIQFRVRGDGNILYTSPSLSPRDPAIHLKIPIRGVSALTLSAQGTEVGDGCAVWAQPRLVKLPPHVPVAVSPDMNEVVKRPTPLVWKAVDGAAGYLLELQCLELRDPADETSANRFTVTRLPAETTVYTFAADTMPKGVWRWRVHALSRTGFLGEMQEWRTFIAQ